MQEFTIKQDATMPILRLEIIKDGRHNFNKCFDAIQNSEIYFTMTNMDSGVIKIANAPCYIKLRENNGCVEEYVICYDWKKRDTKEKGRYEGEFNIIFSPIKSDSTTYPNGELIMPIREKLLITIL